jgi:hypothetical protein
MAASLYAVGCGGDDSNGSGGQGAGGSTSDGSGGSQPGSSSGGGGETGTGGGDPCAGAQIEVSLMTADPPPMYTLDVSCPNGWGSNETPHALGYNGYTGGTPDAEHETFISACTANGAAQFGMEVPVFDVGAGKSDTATFSLSGAAWTTTDGLDVMIYTFGDVGQKIHGTFSGTLTSGDGTSVPTTGVFDVCRVSDFLPP